MRGVNARGDTIDNKGNIIVPVTKKIGDNYQKTVMNRAANIINRKKPSAIQPDVSIDELHNEELEFHDTSNEDKMIQEIKNKEEKDSKKKEK